MKLTVAVLLMFLMVCSHALEWWESGNYYQVYPRSFKDSNGDGVGDLKGVISKVSYLKDLGMSGVWLSPIMKSPMIDHGYDISDYREIDPLYGTMADFDQLVAECQSNGIHLILDFVPNHTSDEHEWFKKSERRENGYEDYFMWHPGNVSNIIGGGRPGLPNNWVSVMKGPAWTWSEKRQAYFYHAFSSAQPDLNYRNPKVVDEMKEVLRFWLKRKVSGFRIDAVENLFEVAPDKDGNYPDEPISGDCDDPQNWCYLKHIHVMDLPETVEMVYQWREVLDERDYGESKVMMTEAYPPLNLLTEYYQNEAGTRKGAHIPFNFEIIFKLSKESSARQCRQVMENYMNYIPVGHLPNWVLGNHDRDRIATRLGSDRIDLFNVLLQTMPGHAITYQGEEIGMDNAYITWNQTQDPQACNTNSSVYHLYSRDPVRTPMQWNANQNAGFSSAPSTWLPLNENYKTLNVEAQESDPNSHLNVFKKMTSLRQKSAFKTGTYRSARNVHDDLLVYVREDVKETFLVILNFGSVKRTFSLDMIGITKEFRELSENQIVVLDTSRTMIEGKTFQLSKIEVQPKAAVIFKNSANKLLLNVLFTFLSAAITFII